MIGVVSNEPIDDSGQNPPAFIQARVDFGRLVLHYNLAWQFALRTLLCARLIVSRWSAKSTMMPPAMASVSRVKLS